MGDEAPLEAIDHAEVEIFFGRSGVARHGTEAGALGVGEDDIDLHDDVGEREAVDGGDAACVGLGTALLPLMAKLPTWVVQSDRGRRCRPG